MGEIIAFPSSPKPIGAPRPPIDGGGEILFFLGVRYVRGDDERTRGAPRTGGGEAGRGKKRKRRA
ncbi:MAG: hypothetical protein C3F11_13700 [Methylocystaceae bacterium]|nr:MAG: hypothetical protein C3F11_13700 [Methylocystaceae bacterium]